MQNPTESKKPHAVVIGSSIAGMLTARILMQYFERVTIIERDQLPATPQFRAGTPQARHPHILLKQGELIIEKFFPGITAELYENGAVPINFGSDTKWIIGNQQRPTYESKLVSVAGSRIFLEGTIRNRLRAYPDVTFVDDHEVTGLLTDDENRQVRGVQIRQRGEGANTREVLANLVVDASGRQSKAPEWLAALGYQAPAELSVNSFAGYSTRVYERPTGQNWKFLYVQPSAPANSRGLVMIPMEGNRLHVCLVGLNADYPPTDEEGYLEFVRSLGIDEAYELLKELKPLSPIVGYRRAENRLRRYDLMPSRPENFLLIGDSVYALNPVYAQGMSVAAISAETLDNCIQEAGSEFTCLAENFQKQLVGVIMLAWQMAVGEDLRWSNTQVSGEMEEAGPEAALLQNYMDQVIQASLKNPNVAETFYQVMNMVEAPTVFFRPDVVLQVAAEMSGALSQQK
ncbi:MAG TPA: FAD-dependent monooxygenase [Chloroflexia bacterium]|nr:FAD-dependent monooxygenase [Chloroflexia bacterium]